MSLVRAYNDWVIEAYRSGDPRLVEDVTGPEEARRIAGLIGVKSDLGITLDASLLIFKAVGIERGSRDEVDVLTEERWHYRDRRIGTGEQIGEDSTDSYRMRYLLRRFDNQWRVSEVRFESPPQVGRTSSPVTGDPAALHGVDSRKDGR